MSKKGYKQTEEHKRKLREANVNKKRSIETRKKMIASAKIRAKRPVSEETKKSMSVSQLKRKQRDGYINSEKARKKVSRKLREYHRKKGHVHKRKSKKKTIWPSTKNRIKEKNPFYGKKHTQETKRKQRESTISYIEKTHGTFSVRIGTNEKRILDRLEKRMGYNIDRKFRINGYFPDGYIHELNLIVEVDERPKNKPNDIEREKTIKKALNCKFLRIKDYN